MEKLALSIGGTPIPAPNGIPTGGSSSISQILGVGFNFIIIVAIILAGGYIIWGGFDWILSEGKKEDINKAREKIFIAIVGLVLVFMSFFIINFILYFFQVNKSSSNPSPIPTCNPRIGPCPQ